MKSRPKKRVYRSEVRVAQAAQTRRSIIDAARKLFQSAGFEGVTIEQLAQAAEVSAPTIYALFQSKRGVLRALMDEALPEEQFLALVEQTKQEKSPSARLKISAKIARQLYDAEKAQMNILRGAALLTAEFKKIEKEWERRRHQRQEETVLRLAKEKSLAKGLTVERARDILWAFTGRDLYRMFVIEQGWTSDEYEKWLAQMLIKTLIG